jgi:2-dehydro-3-deoxygluconokinase
VVVKQGEYGAWLFDGDEIFHAPAYPVEQVVDPTGAGDTFGGAFIARLVAGDSLPAAARYAAAAAALSTEGYGAVEPIPRAERVRQSLAARPSALT